MGSASSGAESEVEEEISSGSGSSESTKRALSPRGGEAESLSCLADFARFIMHHAKVVILFWLVVSLGCIPLAVKFTDILKINFSSPPGSGAELAEINFKKHFPPHGLAARYVGYLEVEHGSIEDVPGIDNFCRELQRQLNATRVLDSFMSPTTYADLTEPLGRPANPIPLVSKDKKAMLIPWTTADEATGPEAVAWATGPMHKTFMNLVPDMLGPAVTFYGTDSYSETVAQAVPVAEADMARVDMICIPITTAVLFMLVRSCRLLLIAGATLGVASVISYAAVYVLGCFVSVMSVTPGLMSCLMISVSIDYAIFLLMRFREELPSSNAEIEEVEGGAPENDVDWDDAIDTAICNTMATSGATIVMSGFVLLLSFIFMACFPIQVIASMGIGACIAMTVMILVNLTLVPALLSEFRVFFTKSATKRERGRKAREFSDKVWRRIAIVVTKSPNNIIALLIVVALSLAVSYPILDMQTSGDLRQIVGMGTRLAKVGTLVSERFGGGMTFSIEVLLVPANKSIPIFSDEFFKQSSAFLQAIQQDVQTNVPEAKDSTFNFLTFQTARGEPVNFAELDTLCLITKHPKKPMKRIKRIAERVAVRAYTFGEDLRPLCNFLVNGMTNTRDYHNVAPTATYGVIIPSIEPMGKLGQKLLDTLRAAAIKHGAQHGIEAWYGGDAVKNLDMITSVYSTFPKAMIATVATAAFFLLVAFRSIVVPIRCLVGNVLTLGFTYGFTVLTYQYGILDFVGMEGVNGKYKSLPWCAPVIVFFIIFGIGLDYDLFLLVRITELRGKGKSPQEAVREGLVSTGGIITAAGLVMACAFSGMLFSSMFQQAMFGFMIASAVLFDTFVARSVVTPAGMSLLGYWNWWPSRLSVPEVEAYTSISEDEYEDEGDSSS